MTLGPRFRGDDEPYFAVASALAAAEAFSPPLFLSCAFASASQVSTTVSGLSDMLSIFCSRSHCARSGWSDGPCPHIPAYLPALRQASIAIDNIALTAAS